MKERPILFSAPMVRALLARTKTQTRRLVKPQAGRIVGDLLGQPKWYLDGDPDRVIRCPYGVPGDRLWVKETWARRLDEDHLSPSKLEGKWAWYWADPQTCNTGCAGAAGKKRVSIHMPRWASRITLEVTEVRVQRLQDISEEDARAEGMAVWDYDASAPGGAMGCTGYARLWNVINGVGAWETNPWVWAISFRRVEPTP